jgi:hypothetical protein
MTGFARFAFDRVFVPDRGFACARQLAHLVAFAVVRRAIFDPLKRGIGVQN